MKTYTTLTVSDVAMIAMALRRLEESATTARRKIVQLRKRWEREVSQDDRIHRFEVIGPDNQELYQELKYNDDIRTSRSVERLRPPQRLRLGR